jgi:hypothetical protein
MMKELGLKPYRPQFLHALNDDDPDRRCEFADIFLNLVDNDPSLLDRIFWTDESTFKLNGHVNRHNCVYYATENPHIVISQEMNAPGVIVWAGIWSGGIIGPFFFHDTVTAESYLEKLNDKIVPAIENRMNLEEIFDMHDGAPPHYAQSVRKFLHETFPDRWIGLRGRIDWPARSSDLTLTDFFLWAVIKDRVYATKPQKIQALKDAITTEMQRLPEDLCRRACQSVSERLQLCKDLDEVFHTDAFSCVLFSSSVALIKVFLKLKYNSFLLIILCMSVLDQIATFRYYSYAEFLAYDI